MKYKLGIIAVGTIAAVGAYSFMAAISASAEAGSHSPKYRVIEKLGNGVEVRMYQSAIVAQVQVRGDQREALNGGFRILAGYIFGKNKRRTSMDMTSPVAAQSEKIAMTSPVVAQCHKIAMTSPVTSQSTGDSMTVSFFMPPGYSLDTLPEPQDNQIRFVELPERKLAAIGFSGSWNPQSFSKHAEALMRRLRVNNIQAVGEPFNAYYDPPFMPPFMRRNEVLVSIAD